MVEIEPPYRFRFGITNKRDWKTLAKLLQFFITPGSHLISDGWAAYVRAAREANLLHTVSIGFKAGKNINKSLIESRWGLYKRELDRTYNSSLVHGNEIHNHLAFVFEAHFRLETRGMQQREA